MPWPRFPRRRDAKAALAEMRKILARLRAEGVPEDLVTAAKRHEVADAEFERNSIPGLANVWSNAIAAEGRALARRGCRGHPAGDARRCESRRAALSRCGELDHRHPAARAVRATGRHQGFGGAEQVTAAPTAPVRLPPWASADLTRLEVPSEPLEVSDATLPNGLRLIVRTDRTSPTISVSGSVKHDFGLQTPPGKEGVSDLLSSLFSYGTPDPRSARFQKALDDIAANETAGYSFSLTRPQGRFLPRRRVAGRQ